MYIENIDIDENFCDDLYKKKFAFDKHYKKIKNLALGSSHIDYAIFPDVFYDCTFNFGFTSADLFASFYLLKEYGEKLENLENIIVGIDIFSPGYDLLKTNEKYRCFYCKKILGIPYDVDADSMKFEKWRKSISKLNCDENFFGYKENTWFGNWEAVKRYEGHLKNFCRNDSQMKYLQLISDWCNEHKKRLICVILPCRPDFKKITSKNVIKLLEYYVCEYAPNAEIVNLFYEKIFEYKDFGDTDHLQKSGAIKVSKEINNIIVKSKKQKEHVFNWYFFVPAFLGFRVFRQFISRKIKNKIQKRCK